MLPRHLNVFTPLFWIQHCYELLWTLPLLWRHNNKTIIVSWNAHGPEGEPRRGNCGLSIDLLFVGFQIQIQIQKNFIATQDNVFYVQSQRMLQFIFLSQTYPSTYITWVIQVLTHCCQDKRSPPLDDILKCIFLSQTYPSTYIIWVIQVLTHCCRDKATAAPRRHSQMHLPEWKYVDFGQNSTETHPQGPNQQHSSIGADIGLVPNGRQATIWTNDDYFNDAYKRHSTLMSQQEKIP